jgi:hypothetical protein
MTPLLSPHSSPRFSVRLRTLDVRTADLAWDPSPLSDHLIVLQPSVTFHLMTVGSFQNTVSTLPIPPCQKLRLRGETLTGGVEAGSTDTRCDLRCDETCLLSLMRVVACELVVALGS